MRARFANPPCLAGGAASGSCLSTTLAATSAWSGSEGGYTRSATAGRAAPCVCSCPQSMTRRWFDVKHSVLRTPLAGSSGALRPARMGRWLAMLEPRVDTSARLPRRVAMTRPLWPAGRPVRPARAKVERALAQVCGLRVQNPAAPRAVDRGVPQSQTQPDPPRWSAVDVDPRRSPSTVSAPGPTTRAALVGTALVVAMQVQRRA